jgi:predicted TPR repeat methyltransferase
VQFTKALERAPRRTLSLVGLAQAAERAGDLAAAQEARQTLDEIWKNDKLEATRSVPLASVVN